MGIVLHRLNNRLPGRHHSPVRSALLALLWTSLAGCIPAQTETATPVSISSPAATVTPFLFPSTFTPGPTGQPTGTHTPGPSRTPVPTVTLGPTLEPSPTPLVEILTATSGDSPLVSARLLFVAGGQVRIWDSGTGEILPVGSEALPGDFDRISLSTGGSYFAGTFRAENRIFITVYNRITGEIVRMIEPDGDELFDLALSPNGLRLAFITSVEVIPPQPTATPQATGTGTATPETGETPTPTASPVPAESNGSKATRSIFLVDLTGSAPPEFMGVCDGLCTRITWAPGSDFIIWGQSDGLWGVAAAASAEPELLLEPFVEGVSAGLQTTGSFLPISVSPSGRFILVRKGITTGSILAVLDRNSGRSENLPGTGVYTGDGTALTWLPGDALLIARPGIVGLDILPAAEIWALTPGNPDSLFAISAEFILSANHDVRPGAPVALPDGRIGLSLVNLRDGNDADVNGLYLLDPNSGALERVNFLPLVLVEELVWLPDLSGAIVFSDSRLLFVPAGFGPVYSMRLLLGTGACCFKWIP